MKEILELLKEYEKRNGYTYVSIKIFSDESGVVINDSFNDDEIDFHDLNGLRQILKLK